MCDRGHGGSEALSSVVHSGPTRGRWQTRAVEGLGGGLWVAREERPKYTPSLLLEDGLCPSHFCFPPFWRESNTPPFFSLHFCWACEQLPPFLCSLCFSFLDFFPSDRMLFFS